MRSYQANITIEDPSKLVLTNLPFSKGEKIHVVVESERDIEARRLRDQARAQELFKKIATRMDKESEFQSLSEEDIAREINASRRGQ